MFMFIARFSRPALMHCFSLYFRIDALFFVPIPMLNKLDGGLAGQRVHVSPSSSVRLSSGKNKPDVHFLKFRFRSKASLTTS